MSKIEERFSFFFPECKSQKLSGQEVDFDLKKIKYYRDLKNSLDTAFEEGRLEGVMKGKMEGKIEVIKNGLQSGLDLGVLSKLTGLTEEEIRKIIDEGQVLKY